MNNSPLLLAALRILLPMAKREYAELLAGRRYPELNNCERERADQLSEGIAYAEDAIRNIDRLEVVA